MLSQLVWLVLETVGSLLATAFVLRAWMQRVRLHPRNPVSPFIFAVTDWLVKPLRRIVPGTGGVDWSSVLGALVISVLLAIVYLFLQGGEAALTKVPAFGWVCLVAVFWLIKWTLYLVMVLVLIQAVLSWVNPYAPMAPLIRQLTDPFTAPLQRVIPLVGNVDLSPLALLLIIQILLFLLQSVAMGFGIRL